MLKILLLIIPVIRGGKLSKKLLVCDLDNTLYDWVAYFVPAFTAMVDEAIKILGCSKQALLSDLKSVHQKHHDTEHPFALLETRIVSEVLSGLSFKEKSDKLDSAFYAFNSTRKKNLRLYSGVEETLRHLKRDNVRLVAHTEGKLASVLFRLDNLKIMDYFSAIYCRERSMSVIHTKSESDLWLARFPQCKIKELPPEDRKPNARVLMDICRIEGFNTSEAAYVGDSMGKDIFMAKSAGVYSVWAKYGSQVETDFYKALVEVSHWTLEDIEKENAIKAAAEGTYPDAVLEHHFSEIVSYIG